MRNTPSKSSLLIINVALMAALFLFLMMLFTIFGKPEFDGTSIPESLIMIVFILGFMAVPMSCLCLFLPLVFGFWRRAEVSKQPTTLAQKIFFDFDDKILFTKMMPITIMRLAFAEAVALFGFVLAFLTHNLFFYLPFMILSLVLMVLVGPLKSILLRPKTSDVVDYTNI